jgi:hypothetical protein
MVSSIGKYLTGKTHIDGGQGADTVTEKDASPASKGSPGAFRQKQGEKMPTAKIRVSADAGYLHGPRCLDQFVRQVHKSLANLRAFAPSIEKEDASGRHELVTQY